MSTNVLMDGMLAVSRKIFNQPSPSRDPLLCCPDNVLRGKTILHHHAAGNNCDIRSLLQDLGMANLQVRTSGVDLRNAWSAEANVEGSRGLPGFSDQRLRRRSVGGNDDSHVRDRPHRGHILDSLMRGTVRTHANAAMRRD